MKKWVHRVLLLGIVIGIGGMIVVAMQPQPVLVDIAIITRGPLVVTIRDDGRTRIRDRYVVSAPLTGRLVRIALDPGDSVEARESLLAVIEPTDSALLDPRTVKLATARMHAAEKRVSLAQPKLESAKASMELEQRAFERQEQLLKTGATTETEYDRQRVASLKATSDWNSAKYEAEIAQFEFEQAEAALLHTRGDEVTGFSEWSFPITSPISGRVLRVFQKSSTVVNAGDQILELGDPNDLEVEVDVLSTDAVKITAGARVMLKEWGGDHPLEASVRQVEPSAYTKVSALGIEEQRVNVIIDFIDPPAKRPALGDGYRVEAEIVRWEASDVLTVPSGALFRDAGEWAVFVIEADQAALRHVELGHRNDDAAEVLSGLEPETRVILYPGDRIEPRTLVTPRADVPTS